MSAGSNSILETFSAPMLCTPNSSGRSSSLKIHILTVTWDSAGDIANLLRFHMHLILNTCVCRTWQDDGEHPWRVHNASNGSSQARVLLLYGFYEINFVHRRRELCVGLLSLYCVTHF
jgi:hypothetical protein